MQTLSKFKRLADSHGVDEITLADYLGAAYLTVGEVIHLDYSAYRNITRWLSNMEFSEEALAKYLVK